jgi:N-methylhydantoinase B
LEFGVNSNRGYFPPQGVFGGSAGSPTRYWVCHDNRWKDPLQLGLISLDKFSGVRLVKGDRLLVETPGGGGWGDPRERDRERINADLRDGLISRDAAIDVYGLSADEADHIIAKYHWNAVL